jgi:phage tail sheath protein FI
MYAYQTPGVYFEWQDKTVRPPAIQRTDIAGFVGIADRGPLHEPVKVESWTQFVSAFGRHTPQGYLAYAVEGFFANGGRSAWIVRAADPETAKAASFTLLDDDDNETLALTARWQGRWAHLLVVTVLRTSLERFSLLLRHSDGGQEIWSDLSMKVDDARYAPNILNEQTSGSSWLVLEDVALPTRFPRNVTPNARAANLSSGSARLSGGEDGLETLTVAHLSGDGAPPESIWGLACFEKIDEIAVVALPDIMPKLHVEAEYKPVPVDCQQLEPPEEPPLPEPEPLEFPPDFELSEIETLQKSLIGHCERLRDRFAILDLPFSELAPESTIAWRKKFDTSYAAIYFPWLIISDPLALTGITRTIPPSAQVAGVYARGDLDIGVHKPPANQVVEGAASVNAEIDERLHGRLNQQLVNVIRPYSGRGVRVSGARTLSSDTTLRYINVRRLLMMIIEVIDERAQSLVFEPNNTELWRRIERVIGAFLDQIWRAGMLDGATPEDAYYVRCDSETNPPEEQAVGRVTSLVGVQPPWPAEFVIVRIGFTESGAALQSEGA